MYGLSPSAVGMVAGNCSLTARGSEASEPERSLFDLSESRTVTSNATPKMTESTAASRTVARTAPQTAPIVVATQRNRPIRMFEMPSRK